MPATLMGNGGLGHALEARYRVAGYVGFKGLQVVQVFYGTPADGDPVGIYEFDLGGKKFRGYVDGGYKSRNALQNQIDGHVPGKPYYYRVQELELEQNYDWDPVTGTGSIMVYDRPMGLRIHDEGYFETAVVAVPNDGTPDEVVHVLRWGWMMNGMVYKPTPEVIPAVYKAIESTTVSETFRQIITDNYADYQFVDNA